LFEQLQNRKRFHRILWSEGEQRGKENQSSSQILHSIHTAHAALAQKDKRILRFCWETNGTMNSCFLEEIPLTSRRHAEECREAALEAGLRRVKIGNIHLLGRDY
jgi:hypothetical protein